MNSYRLPLSFTVGEDMWHEHGGNRTSLGQPVAALPSVITLTAGDFADSPAHAEDLADRRRWSLAGRTRGYKSAVCQAKEVGLAWRRGVEEGRTGSRSAQDDVPSQDRW